MTGLFLLLILTRCSSVPTEADLPPGAEGQLAEVLIIEPVESVVMGLGTALQFRAIPETSQGDVVDSYSVTWTSSDEAVATVSPQGLVTAVSEGTVQLTATAENPNKGKGREAAPGQLKKNATITVDPTQVASVEVSPASATLEGNATAQLTATVRDADGNQLNGRYVAWSTSSPAVATVDGHGLVTGQSEGSSTIDAESEGKSGSASIAVQAALPPLPPPPPPSGTMVAFPGAEGYGATALSDCRSLPMVVHKVTNTNADGPGSWHDIIENRLSDSKFDIVIFETGGTIMTGHSKLLKSCVYLAGQTAPGDGVQIRGPDNPTHNSTMISIHANDIVLRYLRLRGGRGEAGKPNNIAATGGRNIILDHLSLAWDSDKSIGMGSIPGGLPFHNVTVQWTIIAASLRPHSTGMLLQWRPELRGDAPMYSFSINHNFFAHNHRRNPWFDKIRCAEVVNNVVYNWSNRVGSTHEDSCIDYVANYYKPGPWSPLGNILEHEIIDNDNYHLVLDPAYLYMTGNVAEHMPTAAQHDLVKYSFSKSGPLPSSAFTNTRQTNPAVPTTVYSASEAFQRVLADVGANRRLSCAGAWLTARDQTDDLFVTDAKNGTAPVTDYHDADHQDDYGGYPNLRSGQACADTDGDGMPDEYETAKFGSATGGDPAADSDGDGYTNMEEYLNGTDPFGI